MRRLDEELEDSLLALRQQSLHRYLQVIEGPSSAITKVGGREVVLLCSNNYLDLANHPALKQAAVEAIERYGVGTGASRLVAGSLEPLHELEAKISRLKKAQAALVFGSGYLANVGTISALVGRGDVIFSDELNHASLIDGCRLSRATVQVYRHCDIEHLAALLKEVSGVRRKLIVTDAVFSMDGDCAPLKEIVELARRYGAWVMVDEAHAVGVFGPAGAGLVSQLGLEDEIDIGMGTLSKALGSYGAYVVGSHRLIDFLINRARTFIYTTGISPPLAAAASAAISLMEREPARIERLWRNADFLRRGLLEAGFNIGQSSSPIIPVIVGDSGAALALAQMLYERGIFVRAIRPPTVPPGTARLRVTPTAGHSLDDLQRALDAFVEAGKRLGLIH